MNRQNTQNNLNGGLAFLIMIALFMLISFIGQSILNSASVTGGRLFYAISATFSLIAMGIVIVYAKKTAKNSLIEVVSFNKTKSIYFVFAIILSIGMFLGLGFLNTVVANLFTKWGLNAPSSGLTVENGWDLLLFGILLALLPAVLEESFFRGVMLKGEKSLGIVISVSVCFALYHGSVATLCYQFIYGLALTYLAVKSQSTAPSMLAHFINNFAVLLFTLLRVQINLFNGVIIAVGLLFLALFWVGIILYQKEKPKADKNAVKEFWIPSGVLGAGLMVLLIVLNLFA